MVNRGVDGPALLVGRAVDHFVQHTEADIDKHLSAFDDIAASLAKGAARARSASRGRALNLWLVMLMWGQPPSAVPAV